MIDLPAGFAGAPLAGDDLDRVVALVRACELHDSGESMYERADLVADLVEVDRQRDTVVVRAAPGAPVVAWGMILRARSRWADVRPDHRGLGIGRALVDWSAARGRQLGADRIGQTVEDVREDAIALFRAAGAVPVRTAWILRRDNDGTTAPDVGVPGIVLRDSTTSDEVAALEMMELAFSQWPDRAPSTLQAWQAMVTAREGFTSDQLQLALTAGGDVVGAAFLIDDGSELWVDKLATHPDRQGQGIGSALLGRAFGMAVSRGRTATVLSTDSNTGAIAFYERLGMHVTRSFTHWAIPLAGPARST